LDRCPTRSSPAASPTRDRSGTQHLDVVVRLHDQYAATAQVSVRSWHVAEIGGEADFHAFGAESEAHRIGGVVRMVKGMTSISPTRNPRPAEKCSSFGRSGIAPFSSRTARLTHDAWAGQKHRYIQLGRQALQPQRGRSAHGDQNRGDFFHAPVTTITLRSSLRSRGLQALEGLAAGKTHPPECALNWSLPGAVPRLR